MRPETHYTPSENGYVITGSSEVFNRTLYGSHAKDEKPERFFTFAGDAPLFMGALCDWTAGTSTYQRKCGVLSSGLAITPGQRSRFYYSGDIDQTSGWFHRCEDIRGEFTNGWMEYELSQISSWFPDVRVSIEAYPLMPDDGYLVHYRITTDQRVFFTAGFGGITGIQGRFEYKGEPRRNFTAEDTKGNRVILGENRACVTHTDGSTVRIGASFPADFSIGSAAAMAEQYPSTFLSSCPEHEDDQVVKISAAIDAGKVLDGYLIVLCNAEDATLDKWLKLEDPIGYIKQQIYSKFACIDVATPEKALDLTIAPTVIALDASWHKDSFHHGAFAYHAPFLGWRNWYAPTALGWYDRVAATIQMWLSHITRGDVQNERVWYDETPIAPGENKFDKRFHTLQNPVGRLPAFLKPDLTPVYGPYNMQECALDMMLYYIEWSGDLSIAEKHYDDLCAMADWEKRTFDPDDDGLYQNVLNTWISDGHNYNGAGCAQSSAYNYRANLVLSKLAKRLGRDGERFAWQAAKIRDAVNAKLWIPASGVIAESVDTVGNCLIHPSVELATVYHGIDSQLIDDRKAYCTLKFTENHLKNIVTPGSDGRLCYSSNWLPKQYSTCGIFPAENAHLALAYFQLGLKEQGKRLLDGIVDCYFTGKNPGLAAHIQSARCASDLGDLDFTDVSSTYLRLVVEGLFGIRINALDNCISIAPGFPEAWEQASLTLQDIALTYHRQGNQEIFHIFCARKEKKQFRIPLRAASVDAVLLDGQSVAYRIEAAVEHSFLIVEADKPGQHQLRVIHGSSPIPTVSAPNTVLAESRFVFEVKDGTLVDIDDVSQTLEKVSIVGNRVYANAKNIPGDHTLFLHVTSDEYDAWLAADYVIAQEQAPDAPLEDKPFTPVDISRWFNCNITDLHEQAYVRPRPQGFSMGLFQNGRYSHNWNQYGRNVVYAEDSLFRNAGGTVVSPSGIPFSTAETGNNLACVSIYDNFPTSICVPLTGKAQELAILFIASTYCMQSYVENVRVTVRYTDGTETATPLIYPLDLDDWLTSALATRSDCFYFNDFNHATVKRIPVDPNKELSEVQIEAIANEVIFGVAGISIA